MLDSNLGRDRLSRLSFRGLPQTLHANAGIVSRSGHNSFLQNSFKFIVWLVSHLISRRYQSQTLMWSSNKTWSLGLVGGQDTKLFVIRRDCSYLLRQFLARGFFYPEDGGDMFLRNVGTHKIYTAPHPRRRHSSYSPLWKPQILRHCL
jgi:hypothetical protein